MHGTAEQIRPHIAIRQDYVIGRKMISEQQDVEGISPGCAEQLENNLQ
jgi:hypothetical protein